MDRVVSLHKDDKVRMLSGNLRRDLGRLQVAILRKSKHDIAEHLGAAIERSEELVQTLAPQSF